MKSPVPPFAFLSASSRNRLLPVAIVLALGMTAVMSFIGRPLTTEAAPDGIISYEFAGSVENAQRMIGAWDARAQLVAAFSLGLDFLYPLLYAGAISLACVWAAVRVRPSASGLAAVGIWLAWGAWLAAGLDYVENIALIQLLLGATAGLWPPLAFLCAAIKFILVILGLLYVLAAWLVSRIR